MDEETKKRLIDSIGFLSEVKKLSGTPTFDDVRKQYPQFENEFAVMREYYDKYIEWPALLMLDRVDSVNIGLACAVLKMNKVISMAYSALVEGRFLKDRWESFGTLSEEDEKLLDEKKAEIIIFIRRTDYVHPDFSVGLHLSEFYEPIIFHDDKNPGTGQTDQHGASIS